MAGAEVYLLRSPVGKIAVTFFPKEQILGYRPEFPGIFAVIVIVAEHGNRTKAASLLGISRDTLYRKLRQFGETVS